MTRADMEKLDGGEDALAIYRAILTVHDAEPAAFWPSMPLEIRPEALACIDVAVAKLVALGVEERLAAIVRAAPGRRS
jgi:hypothetical protein